MKKMGKALAALLIAALLLSGAIGFAALAGGYVQATASVNVRKGPGLYYSDVGTLTKGQQLSYLGETSTDSRGVVWYKVNYKGSTAWVSSVYSKIVSGGSSSGSGYVEATGGQSNLRSGPGLAYSDVGTLHKGETVSYLGEQSTDDRGVVWYKVSYKGKTCWVSSRFTTLRSGSAPSGTTPSTGNGYVRATSRVNVRSGPGTSYKDMGTLTKGEQVEYLGVSSKDNKGNTWYKVQYYSFGVGWVSAIYSTIVYTGGTGIAKDTSSASGSYVKATGGKTNLRSGPGLGYTDIGTVQKGETATYLGSQYTDERGVVWYKVKFEGKEGWVSSRYTTLY